MVHESVIIAVGPIGGWDFMGLKVIINRFVAIFAELMISN